MKCCENTLIWLRLVILGLSSRLVRRFKAASKPMTISAVRESPEVFFSPEVAKQISGNWPSTYQLMPRWEFVDFVILGSDQYTHEQVYAGQTSAPQFFGALPDQARADAYQLWSAVQTPSYGKAHAIVGVGIPTVGGIDVGPNLTTFKGVCIAGRMVTGDGTVPYRPGIESQWTPSSNFRYIKEKHEWLPGNKDVRDAILALLRDGQLPETLKVSRSSSSPLDPFYSFQKCSPIDLRITNAAGDTTSKDIIDIDGSEFHQFGEDGQIIVPASGSYTAQVVGTGAGTFTLAITRTDSSGQTVQGAVFGNVPVRLGSTGQLSVGDWVSDHFNSIIPGLVGSSIRSRRTSRHRRSNALAATS